MDFKTKYKPKQVVQFRRPGEHGAEWFMDFGTIIGIHIYFDEYAKTKIRYEIAYKDGGICEDHIIRDVTDLLFDREIDDA